jgi:hypothetical protein
MSASESAIGGKADIGNQPFYEPPAGDDRRRNSKVDSDNASSSFRYVTAGRCVALFLDIRVYSLFGLSDDGFALIVLLGVGDFRKSKF